MSQSLCCFDAALSSGVAGSNTPAAEYGLRPPTRSIIYACLQVVVLTDASLEESKRISEVCHSHQPPIPFIRVESRGVFASVFCDFGPSFTVYDVDGEWGVCSS